MKHPHTIILAVSSILLCSSALATGKPAPQPAPQPPISMLATQETRTSNHNNIDAHAHADAHADAHAHSSSRSNSTAHGGTAHGGSARAHGGAGGSARAAGGGGGEGGAGGKGGAGGTGGSVGTIDAGSSIGAVSPQQTIGGDSIKSLALSLAVQPPAFTPPMPAIANCAAHVRQNASSGWIIFGGYSQATAEADPSHCTLLDIRNAKVEACQYADAQRIEDLLAAKLLPGYESAGAKHANLTPEQCRMVKNPPPPAPIINHIAEPLRAEAPQACMPAPAKKAKRRPAKNTCAR
jgi:hypothetical protein